MAAKKTPTGKAWIIQAFNADIVKKQGLIRRKKSDVDKYASFTILLSEVKVRDWHLLETGDQYVVLCNSGAVVIHS